MPARGMVRGPGPRLSIRWDVIPKRGGVRRLVTLSPPDERAFSRSVAAAVPAIRRALGAESHANRVVTWDSSCGLALEAWRPARRRWQRQVRLLGIDGPCLAVTDARACYASIAPSVLDDRLRRLGVPEETVYRIGSWLGAFQDAGVEGLPVGPVASAVLADAVLSAGDAAIRAAGAPHVRWVDDVAIFAPDARTRAIALDALRRAWASMGLDLHEGKTVLLDARDGGVRANAVSGSRAATSALA